MTTAQDNYKANHDITERLTLESHSIDECYEAAQLIADLRSQNADVLSLKAQVHGLLSANAGLEAELDLRLDRIHELEKTVLHLATNVTMVSNIYRNDIERKDIERACREANNDVDPDVNEDTDY